MTQLNLIPGGGEALGVRGAQLAIGIGVNFVLGALMRSASASTRRA